MFKIYGFNFWLIFKIFGFSFWFGFMFKNSGEPTEETNRKRYVLHVQDLSENVLIRFGVCFLLILC